jgi:8-oxo-dGTP pyrophosphatase MutT (NUDIX family)
MYVADHEPSKPLVYFHIMISLPHLPELIRRKLSNSDPSENNCRNQSHRELAPEFAYGRHRGPVPRNAHPAAVLIALVPISDSEWTIPLTLRPAQMADHGGQVSLPGGRSDKGETSWRTACREFGEELGCSTEYLQPVGQLKSLYVFASRHQVTPMVGVCAIRPAFQPNPAEVSELLFLSLNDLIADDAISVGTMRKGTAEFDAPGFRIGEHFVWGATAMILSELRFVVRTIFLEKSQARWRM